MSEKGMTVVARRVDLLDAATWQKQMPNKGFPADAEKRRG
jgi:hypothetical protein